MNFRGAKVSITGVVTVEEIYSAWLQLQDLKLRGQKYHTAPGVFIAVVGNQDVIRLTGRKPIPGIFTKPSVPTIFKAQREIFGIGLNPDYSYYNQEILVCNNFGVDDLKVKDPFFYLRNNLFTPNPADVQNSSPYEEVPRAETTPVLWSEYGIPGAKSVGDILHHRCDTGTSSEEVFIRSAPDIHVSGSIDLVTFYSGIKDSLGNYMLLYAIGDYAHPTCVQTVLPTYYLSINGGLNLPVYTEPTYNQVTFNLGDVAIYHTSYGNVYIFSHFISIAVDGTARIRGLVILQNGSDFTVFDGYIYTYSPGEPLTSGYSYTFRLLHKYIKIGRT